MNIIKDDLLDACIRKDRKAQYELYRVSYGFLSSICMRYSHNKDDADELLNMGFLKILTNLDKRRAEIPFTLWMRRVMINTIIDEYRKNKKEKELTQVIDFTEYYADYDYSVINDFIKKSDAEYIHKLVRKLPRLSGKVFNLFIVDGYSHKEIAGMLKMSESTSKWHLNFARNKMKEMLSEIAHPLRIVAS